MKKQFLFAALAVATLFSACSQEEELSKNEGATPVNFVIGGVGARTTTTDAFVASFEVDDEVGIFSTGLKNNQIANGQYKVANSNNIYSLQPVETTDFYFDNEADASFYAYYPYAESVTSNAVTLTVKADQSVTNEADNFNCNDLLVATQTVAAGAATADGVTLAFDHVMSFVELTFGTNLATIGVSEVAMTIASPTITYDFTSTETVKYAVSGAETSIKMYKKGDNKFWAIVPPQTIQGGKALFTITAENDRTYSYTVAADATEEFKSNAVRKIKLDVASPEEPETTTVFKIASISINGWGTIDEEAEEKEVEEVVVPAIELISSITGTIGESTVLNTATSLNDIATEGWWSLLIGNTNTSTISKSSDNSSFELIIGTEGWNNRCLVYRVAADKIENSATKKFKMSLNAKMTVGSQVRVSARQISAQNFFNIGVDTSISKNLSVSSDYLQSNAEFVMDFNKYTTSTSGLTSESWTSTESSQLDDVIIMITANSTNTTVNVKDISLIEVKE